MRLWTAKPTISEVPKATSPAATAAPTACPSPRLWRPIATAASIAISSGRLTRPSETGEIERLIPLYETNRKATVERTLDTFGADEFGLDETGRLILAALAEKSRPVGIATLAGRMRIRTPWSP